MRYGVQQKIKRKQRYETQADLLIHGSSGKPSTTFVSFCSTEQGNQFWRAQHRRLCWRRAPVQKIHNKRKQITYEDIRHPTVRQTRALRLARGPVRAD